MEKYSRSIRRHELSRIKLKRKNYWGGDLDARKLGIVANTPNTCNCWMCINERKLTGEITIQEKRFNQKEKIHEVDLIKVICYSCSDEIFLPLEQGTNHYICDICR